MTEGRASQAESPVYEGPRSWLWGVGTARIVVLSLAGAGAYQFGTFYSGLGFLLLALYGFGLVTSLFYLVTLKQSNTIPLLLTWTQTLVDFAVVAATVSFTGGVQSSFAFLEVIVILEAGLLLGFAQGFVFATIASVFMAIQAAVPPPPGSGASIRATQGELPYLLLIQILGFYLTAFISGYWNQLIHRMQQFQRDILDSMHSGFLMTDRHGAIVVQNRAADRILGLDEGVAIGKPIEQILRVASGGECPALTVLRSRRDSSYEFQAVTGPDETRLLGLTTSQTYDSRRRLTGIIATFTDLTEIARMRQELQSQDRLAAIGELAAGLAHEIRNPVAAIRGAVDELQSNLSSARLVKQLAAIAIRESDHLNEIVTGFLAFARNPLLKREVFDVREVASAVRDLLLHEYGGGALNVRIVAPERPCVISGDRSQIRQVFMNLGKNGVEAMDERGVLSITLRSYPGSLEVRFDDEGPGISPDKVNRIFEPFYTEKERGVGMGLPVCLRIVTAHDGTIRATSREGGGATLTVRLPAAQEEG